MKNNTTHTTRRSTSSLQLRPKAAALAVAACFSSMVWANPTNPTVVHGTASFQQAGNILNVTNSHNAIINWGSFSIGVNELTRFIQPSTLSAVLNRVTGQDPSAILGALQSNGKVFLLNPNGIVFGAGSQINVGGLVASTLNLSNADFLAGRMNFTDGAGAGSVLNQGSINAAGGPVYMVGNAVTNQGIITSPGGEVILAAGNSVELVNPGTPNLRVEIQAASNEARNLGSVVAEAGRIGIYAGLIKQGGVINADSAVAEGGRIMLKSTKRTDLEAGSVTSAKGTTGGQIIALSGMNDGVTQVSGRIDASSNAVSAPGNGGFIETSAATVNVADTAVVAAEARNGGQRGRWLIDPADYYISNSYGGNITGAALSSMLNGAYGGTEIDIQSSVGGSIFVNDAVFWSNDSVLRLLAYGGNIEVNSAIGNSGPGAVKLYAGWDGASLSVPTVGGNGAIFLRQSVSSSGSIHLWAGGQITQESLGVLSTPQLLAVSNNAGVNLTSAANAVGVVAGQARGQFAFSNTSANNLTVGSVGGVNGITVTGTYPGLHANATLSQSGGGQLMVTQPITVTGADGFEGIGGNASISLTSTGGISVSSNLFAYGGNGDTSDGYYNGTGGNATVLLNNTGSSSSLVINAGAYLGADGGYGGSVYSGSGNAGAGGLAIMNLVSSGGLVINGELGAEGGAGGSVAMSSANAGSGGLASIVAMASGTLQLGNAIDVDGGNGGSTVGGNSGNGGAASLLISATGGLTAASGTDMYVRGGNGGYSSSGIAGSGGDSTIQLTSGGNMMAGPSGVYIEVDAGGGGYSGSGSGGAAGLASIKLTSTGGALSLTGVSINADGGESYVTPAAGTPTLVELKSSGNLSVSDSSLYASGSYGNYSANGGNGGGSALIGLISTGGSITVNDAYLYSYGRDGYYYSAAAGGDGLIGITAAGNVAISGGTYAYATGGDGGEGGAGGGSVILVTAGGGLSLTGYSSLYSSGGSTDGYSYMPTGTGGGAAITLAANGAIVVDGSEGYAQGGYGGETRGSAAINVIGGSSIAMGNTSSFYVSSDRFKGGASSIALAAAGSVSLSGDSSLYTSSGGVVGIGGSGITIDSSYVSGSGGVSLSSTGDITVQNDASISSGGNLNITALGNLTVDQYSNLYGSPDVNLNIGGNVNLSNNGRVEAGSPSTINLFFPNGSSSGFFINGVSGITSDPSGTGFYVMGSPAVVGANMFVTYGTPTVVNAPVDTLIVALTQASKPPAEQQGTGTASATEEDKDKTVKKGTMVCR